MAVGTEDSIVFPQPALAKAALAYHMGPQDLMVEPMDHFFNITNGASQSDAVIDAALVFLNDTLTSGAPQ